ncbi:DNA-binding NarL/FixJ family response regulator [Bradyrhizobium sp. LM3.4]
MSAADATILLVDDHSVVREGYRSVLQKQPGLRVIAEAADGAEAYRLFKSEAPDLVIMDLSMPGIGGIEAVRRIRQWDKSARILVFTMHENAGFAVQAIRAGRQGVRHQDQSAGDAGARGDGRAGRQDRHQPRHRP